MFSALGLEPHYAFVSFNEATPEGVGGYWFDATALGDSVGFYDNWELGFRSF
jgi:hypothetical protein